MNLIQGDCLQKLKALPDSSLDSLVTDPPAGISFMGKAWDSDFGGRKQWIAWMTEVMQECLRVLKPGAHGLVWAIPRTSHWTATALEEAGFEVRDVVTHLFGSGFPKSLDVSKAIDKAAGAKREVVATVKKTPSAAKCHEGWERPWAEGKTTMDITAPATDAAKKWQGFGTALKPASEHWILVRKPCSEKTVAKNVLKWGTGALNIDASRVEAKDADKLAKNWDRVQSTGAKGNDSGAMGLNAIDLSDRAPSGRFPANLVLSHTPYCDDTQCDIECAVKVLDGQSLAGGMHSAGKARTKVVESHYSASSFDMSSARQMNRLGDSGGASRFFYCAKISKAERNAGLDCTETVLVSNGPWDSADLKAQLQVDTASSPPRVIAASGTLSKSVTEWNTLLFGKTLTVQSRESSRSTTRTESSSITGSKTLSWLLRSNTSASTLDANCVEVSGGSLAALVAPPSALKSSISAKTAIATNARRAVSRGLLQIRSAGAQSNAHPTVKSSNLMSYLIRMVTPPGGVVLDPFMGSGSTGVAAASEGFQFTGIEKDPEYFKIAKKRVFHAFPKARKQRTG